MAPYDTANFSEEQLIRRHAAYDAYLRNLHRDAATHAAKLLAKSDLLEVASRGRDYDILLCFEVLRQLAHETCKGSIGTEKLLQLIKEEVDELWSDELSIQAGNCWMTDMKEFREDKDKQIDLLDRKYFLTFSVNEGAGLMPAEMPGLEGEAN